MSAVCRHNTASGDGDGVFLLVKDHENLANLQSVIQISVRYFDLKQSESSPPRSKYGGYLIRDAI